MLARLSRAAMASIYVGFLSASLPARADTTSSTSDNEVTPGFLKNGLFPEAGKSLQDFGLNIGGTFLEAFSGNPNMGAFPNHTANNGILIPEIDLDLGKAAGIKGMQIHFAYTIFTLKSNTPTAATQYGDMVGVYLGLPIPNSNNLTKLTIEQKLFHDRLDLEIGQMNPVRVFARANCENIQACISDPVLTIGASEMPFVFALWGGRMKYNFTHNDYIQIAGFEDNWMNNYHNGIHWGTSGATGALAMMEYGRKTTFATARLPQDYEFGFFYNTSPGGSPKGFPVRFIPEILSYPYSGGKGLFSRVRQVIVRGPTALTGDGPRNIALYAAADGLVGSKQPVLFTGWVGMNFTGYVPYRPSDSLGFQLTYNKMNSREAAFETRTRLAAGLSYQKQSTNEFVLAVYSEHRLLPWFSLQFSAQYFINPNDYYDELGPRNPRDGFIGTANGIISLGGLLGTGR